MSDQIVGSASRGGETRSEVNATSPVTRHTFSEKTADRIPDDDSAMPCLRPTMKRVSSGATDDETRHGVELNSPVTRHAFSV
jgi:hypothetical protein